ncbi:MAG: NAD-dependent epimerase/dehydratase family protein [Chitinophagaceae bacterium]|nr:MAG: NAD-dependent epimerase/dehydratase family protein [Chitinophagaceae bacterium]
MNITLTGSLGHIGKPLTAILVKHGHSVTVISSDPARRSAIEQAGGSAAIGTVNDPEFLAKAFSGADAVYTMVPPVSYMDESIDPVGQFSSIGRNYFQAITSANVKHVVNLSSWGAHRDNGTGGIVGTYYLEKIMNQLPDDVGLVHIRPASFYYNLFGFIPSIRYTGKISACYGGEDLTVLVAPEDIAVAVAEELESLVVRRDVRYVASDELSCNAVAKVLGTAIGKPGLQWEIISEEQAMQNLTVAGLPSKSAAMLVELQSGHHKGLTSEDYMQHKPVLGKVKIADFAKEFAAAFQKQVS